MAHSNTKHTKTKSRHRQSVAGRLVGLATAWMPAPLADFFATPLGVTVFMVAAPFLLATGVISVNWSNGAPAVTFDRERAIVVGREVEQRVEAELEAEARLAAERLREERQPAPLQQAAQPAPPAWR
jgi:hypothetical protein